jgi:hypothetical protein
MNLADFLDRLAQGLGSIGERMPLVLSDPGGYPQEAFVLAAGAAVLVIAVVLVGALLIDALPAWRARRSLGYRRRPQATVRRAGVVLAVIAGVLVALALLPAIPPVGRTCDTCHELGAAVTAWEADAHRGVSCYGCHARPGLVGSVQAGAEGAFRLVTRRESDEVRAPVFERRCLGCHGEITTGVTGGEVRMRHSDVIEAGYPCLSCHARVGHTALEREPLPITRSRMSTCLHCHDGVTASSSCTSCHNGRPSDVAATPIGQTADAGITCRGCHKEETDRRCVECHGLELPHPAEFYGQHAALSWNDPMLCVRCHETAVPGHGCDCHSDVNVHGTYNRWFPMHGPAARANYPGGCLCHADSYCLFCHEEIPR